jgi:hypothetical protein
MLPKKKSKLKLPKFQTGGLQNLGTHYNTSGDMPNKQPNNSYSLWTGGYDINNPNSPRNHEAHDQYGNHVATYNLIETFVPFKHRPQDNIQSITQPFPQGDNSLQPVLDKYEIPKPQVTNPKVFSRPKQNGEVGETEYFDAKTGKPLQFQNGGVIEDPMGQWKYPGQVTRIPGTDITMRGVGYPVLGISDTGHTQMMEPGKDYKFHGSHVTEYPQQSIGKSQTGGGGGLKLGGKLPKKQSGGSLPVSLQERQHWNDFARYAHQDPNFGNPDIYDKDTQYGYNKLQEYNKTHPENLIRTPDDVARVQQAFTMLKANPGQYGYANPWSSGKDLKVDRIIGTQTSSTLFPSITETINQGKQSTTTDYGQDYEKWQAAHPSTPATVLPVTAQAATPTTLSIAMKQFGGNVETSRLTYAGTGDIQRSKSNLMSKTRKLQMAQNGTGLAGQVLRSGPNVKNSAPPNPTVTKAPPTGNFVNSTFPMQHGGHVGHNWQTPMYGYGQMGMVTGPYQDGGQMPGGDQQAPPTGPSGAPSQGQQDPQQQQIMQLMQEVEQALQQGASPKEIAKTLAKEGVPKKAAQQIIQQVISQSAQQGQGQQQPTQDLQQAQQAPQGMPQGQTGLRMMATGPGVVPNTDPQLNTQGNNPNWAIPQLGVQTPDAGYPNNIQMGPSGANPTSQPTGVTNPTGDNTPAPGTSGVPGARAKSPWYTGDFYADRAIYAGNRAQDLNQQYQQDLNDPNMTQDQLKREHQAIQGNQIVSGVSAGQSVMNGIETGLGLAGKVFSNAQTRKDEMEQQFYNNNKNRQMIKPDRGNASTPAFARDGYVIPYGTLPFQMGGAVPTQGSDFQSNNPNVMTERGETLTDPNQGPAGPDGQPTGAVVHDTTGDNHSDPSGGNAYNLGPNSVVHSKILGLTVGDFLMAVKGQPHAAYIAAKVTEKYPNPDKEVSYAQLAKLFETKKLAAEVEKIAKKAEDMEKKDPGNQGTSVTRKTLELNKKTLARQDATKKEQMATNTDIAGADGPIHNIAENLKMQGAYGGKVQQETMKAAQGMPPTAGSGIKMKGKQMLLPTAQTGKKVDDLVDRSHQPKVSLDQSNDTPYQAQGSQQLLSADNQYYSPTPATTTVTPPTAAQMPPSPYTLQVADPTHQWTQADGPIGFTYPAPVSPFAPTAGGPYKTNEIPKGYGDPAKEQELRANTAKYFPNSTLNEFPATSPGALQEVQTKETPLAIVDAYKHGYLRFNNNHLNLLKQSDGWKAAHPDGKGDPTDTDWTRFAQIRPDLVLQGHKDNLWGKDAVRYNTFTPETQEAYDNWMKDQRHIGNGLFIDKDYTQGAEDQPEYWNVDLSKLPKKTEDKTTDLPGDAGVTPGAVGNKYIYREGLNPMNIAQPLAALFMRRDPAPYIEDQGAKNALASNTRQQFYNNQAEKAEIQRAHRAATQYNPQNNPSVTAQSASNAYMVGVKSDENAANINAQIQKRYEDRADMLREKAGANKAAALDKLAQRTAQVRWKDSALTLNSIGDIGKAYMENKLENLKSGLTQGMFKNAGYNPWDGVYSHPTETSLVAGAPDETTMARARGESSLDAQREAHALEFLKKGDMESAHAALYGRQKWVPGTKQQLGGKVKRINPKRVKGK